jgi:hypothetical protein
MVEGMNIFSMGDVSQMTDEEVRQRHNENVGIVFSTRRVGAGVGHAPANRAADGALQPPAEDVQGEGGSDDSGHDDNNNNDDSADSTGGEGHPN